MYSDEFSAVVALTHAGFARIARARRGALSRPQSSSAVAALILALSLAGCSVGLDYFPEAAPTPTKYKELKGWKFATPRDWADRGDWWSFYRDPKLAFLLKQVEISNQTVAAAAASYEQARALIREAQAALFPTVTASYTYTRTRTGPAAFGAQSSTGAFGAGPRGAIYTTTFVPQFSGTWDLDVWGKVRRQIESNTSAAQASAADLDNAKLSAQGALATAYFNLRAADALRELLDRTVKEYKTTLEIVQNQFNSGYAVSKADVATAEAQVFATEAQAINVGVQRAQFEHAIAMLIGRPPAELTIAMYPLGRTYSENPGRGSLDAARAAPGHRRGGADDAGAKRADRRRHSRLFPGHFALRPAAMGRPQSRCRSMSPTRCGRWARPARKCCSTAG